MVTVRTALLQALRRGPAYGQELIRLVRKLTGARVRLAPGSVYPALRVLGRERLVRSWPVVPGRRRGGRSRTYYELTVRGIRAAELDRGALGALASRGPEISEGAQAARLTDRFRLGAELSEFADKLARAGRRARAAP